MTGWKAALCLFLIVLPSIVLLPVVAWYGAAVLPKMVRYEPKRVSLAYREVAERLAESPEAGDSLVKRPSGRATGKIGGQPWGYVEEAGRAAVWVRRRAPSGAQEWVRRFVPRQRKIPWALDFALLGGALLLGTIGLSALAVWSFFRLIHERDDFFAATAHDLTTPLAGLRLMIGRNDAEANILADRLMRLVENLRFASGMSGKRPQPKRDCFDLTAAYREAYELYAADYRDLFDGEDVVLRVGAGSMAVVADETMTVQVLWNLLGNDLKYAAPHGRVRGTLVREGASVVLTLSDDGPGLTAWQRKRVFARCYRARTALESGKGGFGIGLSAARAFAEAMGGRLTVSANAAGGSDFSLFLPAASR